MQESTQPTEDQQERYGAYHNAFMASVKDDARELMKENPGVSAEGALVHALGLRTTAALFLLFERTTRIEEERTATKRTPTCKPVEFKCMHEECGHQFRLATRYTEGVACPLPECGCSAIPLSIWMAAVRRAQEIDSKVGKGGCD